jgi:DNA (cytosine-5)-methyltransferase 3A
VNVLSLCDGISCGRIALEKANILIDKYYACEIKEEAIKVSKDNYPDIIRLGNVNNITGKEDYLKNIDMVIFGSPCQDLSIAMKDRKGLDGSKSNLFFKCLEIMRNINPKYFLIENVGTMSKENKDIMTELIGVEPILINSRLLTAQLRKRLYWTNITNITQPTDKNILLKDIITSGYTKREKARAILKSCSSPCVNKERLVRRFSTTGFSTLIFENSEFTTESARVLNQIELERLQTLPQGYTKCLDRNKAAGVIGDGWTVDVITHILSFIQKDEVTLGNSSQK